MAALNFPASPSQGQTSLQNGVSWTYYNGAWVLTYTLGTPATVAYDEYTLRLYPGPTAPNNIGAAWSAVNTGVGSAISFGIQPPMSPSTQQLYVGAVANGYSGIYTTNNVHKLNGFEYKARVLLDNGIKNNTTSRFISGCVNTVGAFNSDTVFDSGSSNAYFCFRSTDTNLQFSYRQTGSSAYVDTGLSRTALANVWLDLTITQAAGSQSGSWSVANATTGLILASGSITFNATYLNAIGGITTQISTSTTATQMWAYVASMKYRYLS